jgi:hypothetical protein
MIVDDLLIIFDQSRIKTENILSFINNMDDHLEFKLSEEENKRCNTLIYPSADTTRAFNWTSIEKPQIKNL